MPCFATMQGKKYLQLIGNNIRTKRIEKGMSQQELADHADIAKSSVQRIENGEMNPTILMLQKISSMLETDLTELIKT
jgi:transcriptional regulator with XRE-family HTH domain